MDQKEMQKLIDELLTERQDLYSTVDRLQDDNHNLRQQVEHLTTINDAQKEQLKKRSKRVSKTDKAQPTVFRMKEHKPENTVKTKYYKGNGKYFSDK